METREKKNITDLIHQLSFSYPIKPDSKWDDNMGSCHLFSKTKLPISYKEGEQKSSFLPLAITRPKNPGNQSNFLAIQLLRKLSQPSVDKIDDKKNSSSPLDLTFFHTPFAYGATANISKLACCDLFNYMGYEIELISKEKKITPQEKVVYIKNVNGKMSYSVITPNRDVVYDIDTDISYPSSSDYSTLEKLKPILFEVTAKKGHTYFTRYNTKRFDIKDWIAQMILPIAALHRLGFVHRDIKLENYLAFITEQGDTHLKLNDYDEIVKCNEKNLKIKGTNRCFPREMCQSSWEKFSDNNKPDKALYVIRDKKSIESFALGVTILDILILCKSKLNDNNLRLQILDLIEKLTMDNPKERLTVEEAMEHPLFGKTFEERNHYFNSIQKKYAQKEIFIDGYYLSPHNRIPEANDLFLILPPYLKKIVMTATELNNQIIFIQTQFDNREPSVEGMGDNDTDELTIRTIIKKAHTLKVQIDMVPFDYTIQINNSEMINHDIHLPQIKNPYKKGVLYLSPIHGHIAYTVITLDGQLVQQTPTSIKAPVPFTEQTLAPLRNHILSESEKKGHTIPLIPSFLEKINELEEATCHILDMGNRLLTELFIRKMSTLSTDILVERVEIAIRQHLRIKKLQKKSSFFNKKSMYNSEHEQANKFLQYLKSLPPDKAPSETLKLILNYLDEQTANYNHSFKSLLIKELQWISAEPFDQWLRQLSSIEKNNLEHKPLVMTP